MSKIPYLTRSAVMFLFCAVYAPFSAHPIGQLPAVNPANVVSALDLYGVAAPQKAKAVATRGPKNTELLIPNKPVGDLWSNNGEPPLRMPAKSEYMTLRSDFSLPEETLDGLDYSDSATEPQYFSVSSRHPDARIKNAQERQAPVVSRTKKNIDAPARDIPSPRTRVVPNKSQPSIRSAPRFMPAQKSPAAKPSAEISDDDNDFAYMGDDAPLSKLSPSQLKKAFKRTFTSENKHLSTYQIDDGFDEAEFSDSAVGFDSSRDLSEAAGVRPLEIKISFFGEDSALSRDNYNLLAEYASIVASNPKRAVQISISERGTRSYDGRKMAARRLAIIEQVLKDSGVADRRIIPVLSQRNDDSFVLRVISSDTFHTLTEKKRDMFGDVQSSTSYKSMSW